MNELQIFTNPAFGSVRTVSDDGAVLFCGSDVAKALGYKSPKDAVSTHCKGGGETAHPYGWRRAGNVLHPRR